LSYIANESSTDTVLLTNGVRMPTLGLGTYKSESGGEVEDAVRYALEIGYRSIDTAAAYENESGVGQAVRESGVSREDIFVTTKVWNDDQGYDMTLRAFDRSLEKLRMDYVDLYLIHWPIQEQIESTWRAMEKLYDDQRTRAIGVSNFLSPHLDAVRALADTRPMVNQIEFHPHLQQSEVVDWCGRHNVQVEAWSPLEKGRVFESTDLRCIGEKYNKSPGQIVIRWQLQRNVLTIPKSATREHIEENADVFDFCLSDEDMKAIDAMEEGRRVGPNPESFPS